jgi:hypothetical protein
MTPSPRFGDGSIAVKFVELAVGTEPIIVTDVPDAPWNP